MGFINRRIDAEAGKGSHDVDAETEKGGHDVEYIQLFAAWNTHAGQSHMETIRSRIQIQPWTYQNIIDADCHDKHQVRFPFFSRFACFHQNDILDFIFNSLRTKFLHR